MIPIAFFVFFLENLPKLPSETLLEISSEIAPEIPPRILLQIVYEILQWFIRIFFLDDCFRNSSIVCFRHLKKCLDFFFFRHLFRNCRNFTFKQSFWESWRSFSRDAFGNFSYDSPNISSERFILFNHSFIRILSAKIALEISVTNITRAFLRKFLKEFI